MNTTLRRVSSVRNIDDQVLFMDKLRKRAAETMSRSESKSYVVLGGGIAGVCCAQELARIHQTNPSASIILVTASEVLKEVILLKQ